MATRERTSRLIARASVLLLAACSALPIGGTRPPDASPSAQGPGRTRAVDASPSPPGATSTPRTQSSIPLCRDLKPATAPAEYYRDTPIYVANEQPTERVRRWALGKPGFQELWIDREHNGWVTLAFSQDAQARQAELEDEFPGVGVVAVEVDWTKAGLEALQQRVIDELMRPGVAISAGSGSNIGAVAIGLGVLSPEKIAAVEAGFAGEHVCLEGVDPADAPPDGPQPQAGDGWRLLADADGIGPAYRTGIAYDDRSYAELWRTAGQEGEPPAVDFDTEVVIWFGVVTGSICPPIRMDDVVVDAERGVIYPEIAYVGFGGCTDDIHPHAYVVALGRSRLPSPPFAIDLDPERPVKEELTIVEADLSEPRSKAAPGDVHPDRSEPEPYYVMPGDFVEDGYATDYRQSAHCGVGWLGPLNDVNWRTSEASGTDWIPAGWREAIIDGEILLKVLLTVDPPRLKATANGHSVIYEATADEQPGCD